MRGKYNSAHVMIDEIDDATKEQIQGFLNHPAFADTYIAIMPDCHAGKGAVVGFTMKLNDYIIPNIIGVDINCGMLMCAFDVKDVDLASLDNFIKKNIPAGFNRNSKIGETEVMPLVDDLMSEFFEIDQNRTESNPSGIYL